MALTLGKSRHLFSFELPLPAALVTSVRILPLMAISDALLCGSAGTDIGRIAGLLQDGAKGSSPVVSTRTSWASKSVSIRTLGRRFDSA